MFITRRQSQENEQTRDVKKGRREREREIFEREREKIVTRRCDLVHYITKESKETATGESVKVRKESVQVWIRKKKKKRKFSSESKSSLTENYAIIIFPCLSLHQEKKEEKAQP